MGTSRDHHLQGKVAIVTGANRGIGKETALQLSKAGAKVILGCRSISAGKKCAQEIEKQTGSSVSCIGVDLSDLDSVKEFSNAVLKETSSIDIFVANAGVNVEGASELPKVTKQGLEMVFGTNYVGHAYMISLLWPALTASKNGSRIVMVSSATSWFGSLKFQHYFEGPAKTKGTYATSKLAMACWGQELKKRVQEKGTSGVQVLCSDPGFVATDIWRGASPFFKTIAGFLALDSKKGAKTTIEAATNEEYESGLFIYPFSIDITRFWKFNKDFTYNVIYALLSKLLFGCSPGKAPSKVYDESAGKLLWETTRETLAKRGYTFFDF